MKECANASFTWSRWNNMFLSVLMMGSLNYFIEKCSAIGPKVSEGKNANAAIIIMTANTITPKVAVSVLSVPDDSGMNFLFASNPAIAIGPMMGRYLPKNMIRPLLTFQNISFEVNPA